MLILSTYSYKRNRYVLGTVGKRYDFESSWSTAKSSAVVNDVVETVTDELITPSSGTIRLRTLTKWADIREGKIWGEWTTDAGTPPTTKLIIMLAVRGRDVFKIEAPPDPLPKGSRNFFNFANIVMGISQSTHALAVTKLSYLDSSHRLCKNLIKNSEWFGNYKRMNPANHKSREQICTQRRTTPTRCTNYLTSHIKVEC